MCATTQLACVSDYCEARPRTDACKDRPARRRLPRCPRCQLLHACGIHFTHASTATVTSVIVAQVRDTQGKRFRITAEMRRIAEVNPVAAIRIIHAPVGTAEGTLGTGQRQSAAVYVKVGLPFREVNVR